jgi:multiple sugar transport system substrate-binding protein
VLAGLLAATTAMALTACSGESGANQELSSEPVTLRFTWWGSDARTTRTQQVIDLFQKAHPNITVKGEFKEWNGYWDSLATTVAANDAPDVIQMDELYLASYAERGALLDLDTASERLRTTDFDKVTLATGAVDGKQYGLPTGVAAYSVVANTDLLAKYGVKLPDDATWTWDDLKAAGAQVAKASGGKIAGIQSWGFDTGGLNVWARQRGASLYDANGKVVIPPDVLAGFWAYLADLAKSGVAPSPSVTVEKGNAGLDQSAMATNTAAFGTWWNTQLPSVSAASGNNLKLLRLPGEAQAQAKGAYLKPSMFWSISARSKHPAEAALLTDFLANNEQAANILLTDRGIPANSRTRAAIKGRLKAADAAAATYLDQIQVGEAPFVTPNGASNIEAILKRHTENVLFGRATPQAAAASFIKELQAEIDAA